MHQTLNFFPPFAKSNPMWEVPQNKESPFLCGRTKEAKEQKNKARSALVRNISSYSLDPKKPQISAPSPVQTNLFGEYVLNHIK